MVAVLLLCKLIKVKTNSSLKNGCESGIYFCSKIKHPCSKLKLLWSMEFSIWEVCKSISFQYKKRTNGCVIADITQKINSFCKFTFLTRSPILHEQLGDVKSWLSSFNRFFIQRTNCWICFSFITANHLIFFAHANVFSCILLNFDMKWY